MPDEILPIGLIGCGHVAKASHLPALYSTPGLRLHAVCDPSPTQLGDMPGVSGYTDPEAFFRSGLAAVVVASPAPCHYENVLMAVRHGIPVLCEKPLAIKGEEAAEMVAAAEKAGVPVYTAFCYRFSPVALKIRDLLAQGAIGQPRSLRLIYNWDLHGKYEPRSGGPLQARRVGRMQEGGPLIDCGTHQIDLAQFWLGSPVVASSGHGAWVEAYEAPDHLWLHLDHANGAHTVVEVSFSYHQVSAQPRREFVYELIGTEGVLRYDREAPAFTLDTAAGRTDLPWAPEKGFEEMYREFERVLRAGGGPTLLTTGAESLRTTELASSATREAIMRRARLSHL